MSGLVNVFANSVADPGCARAARVISEGPISEGLLAEAKARYSLFRQRLAYAPAGFYSDTHRLADGAVIRIVCNSGIDRIFVTPPPGGPQQQLSEWFRSVPASDDFTSGDDTLGPSTSWRVPGRVTEWPDQLTPQGALEDHPGHITWSNPSLKYGGLPIVLAWRGPRDRYAPTSGFSTGTGGYLLPHDLSGFPIGDNLFVDSRYVWINGHKVDTGINKVIAACLHEHDPTDHPGEFVLRVVTDEYPSGSGFRAVATHDLVVLSGATGSSLQSFAEAKSALHVKDTYTAGLYTPQANIGGSSTTSGAWDLWQRPHFNRSGNRLATMIVLRGASGRANHAVSFDPMTWTIDDDFTFTATSTLDRVVTGTGPKSYTETGTSETMFLIAADFEDDTFVHFTATSSYETVKTGTVTDANRHSFTRDETYSLVFKHSVVGEIATATGTAHTEFSYDYTDAGGTRTITGSVSKTQDALTALADSPPNDGIFGNPPFAFIADLSKRAFALGLPAGEATYTASGTLSATQSTSASLPEVSASANYGFDRLIFDVYLDGNLVVSGTTGTYSNTPASSSPAIASYPPSWQNPGIGIGNTSTSSSGVAASFGRTVSTASPVAYPPRYEGDGTYSISKPPRYQHCAASADGKSAYFGAAFFEHEYGYDIVCGLETSVFTVDDFATTLDVPAYATGDHPTLSAPVFMGPATEGAPA